MIFYATNKTFERFGLKEPQEFKDETVKMIATYTLENQAGDALKEWALKLFYFDRRKCIACVNFATKLSIFLIDIKVNELENIGNYISFYIQNIYKDDKEIQPYLEKYFTDIPVCVFAPLKDKSAIASVNHIVSDFALDGYRFYDYIKDRILNSMQLNSDVNFNYPTTKNVDGKKEYIFPGQYFKKVIIERYSK